MVNFDWVVVQAQLWKMQMRHTVNVLLAALVGVASAGMDCWIGSVVVCGERDDGAGPLPPPLFDAAWFLRLKPST